MFWTHSAWPLGLILQSAVLSCKVLVSKGNRELKALLPTMTFRGES